MSRIVSTEDVFGGKPRVKGTRVRVVDVVGLYEQRGLEPEEISERLELDERDVYAALVYYYENPKEVRRQLTGEMTA
ncbi:MAG: DUF433 domain-containing protein [Candidatus Nanohaloarchaea archaeon]